jgi:hypothetical protein
MFADLTDKQLIGHGWGEDGEHYWFQFAVNLSDVEVEQVKLRCSSPDLATETLRRQVRAVYQANADYLALPAPTQAQAAAQVAALTKQLQAVIRLLAPID